MRSDGGTGITQANEIESPRRKLRVAVVNGAQYVSLDDLDGFLRDFKTGNDVARQTLEIVRGELSRSGRG